MIRIQLLTAVALVLVVLAVRAGCSLVGVLHVDRVVRGCDWFGVVWHLVPSLKLKFENINSHLRFL